MSMFKIKKISAYILVSIMVFTFAFSNMGGMFMLSVHATETKIIPVTADAHTQNVSSNSWYYKNFNDPKELYARNCNGGDNDRKIYIKVDCSKDLTEVASVKSAKLWLYGTAMESLPGNVGCYGLQDDSWTETGISYKVPPDQSNGTVGPPNENGMVKLSTAYYDATAKWYSFDVTDFLKSQGGDKILSFKIEGDGTTLKMYKFAPREYSDQTKRPYLEVIKETMGFEYRDSNNQVVDQFVYAKSVVTGAGLTASNTMSKSGVLVLALYDQNGTMKDINCMYGTAEPNSFKSLEAVINNLPADHNGYYAHAYVWDSFDGMQPYFKVELTPGTTSLPQNGPIDEADFISVDGQKITVNGSVYTQDNMVTLEIMKPGKSISEIDYNRQDTVKQVLSHLYQTAPLDKNHYTFQFSMDRSSVGGTYMARIGGTGITAPVLKPFIYVNGDEAMQAIPNINGVNDLTSMKAKVIENENALGLGIPLYDELTNTDSICQALLDGKKNASYNSYQQIRTIFDNATILEGLRETTDSSRMMNILNTYNSVVKLNSDKYYTTYYAKMDDNRKNEVFKDFAAAKAKEPFQSVDKVKEIFDQGVATNVFNASTNWVEAEGLLTAMNDVLNIGNDTFSTYNSLRGKADVIKEMLGRSFADYKTITEEFSRLIADQVIEETKQEIVKTPGGGKKTGSVKLSTPVLIPTPMPTPSVDFVDLGGFEWAKESIDNLSVKEIIQGNGGMFRPGDNVTREEFVKMLVRGFKLEDETASCLFSDVPADAWYYRYISSAVKSGLINGVGDGSFGVGREISRQEMATMAYRVAASTKLHINVSNTSETFNDNDQIDDYAKEAVAIMQQAGIIKGFNNIFAPKDSANRAQATVILDKLLKIKEAVPIQN